jgi:hypothetical protein
VTVHWPKSLYRPGELRTPAFFRLPPEEQERLLAPALAYARELQRINNGKRAERMRAAKQRGTHTLAEWRHLKAYFLNRCVRCGSEARLDRDHVVSVRDGGSDEIKNIQPLCRSCNTWKVEMSQDFRAAAALRLGLTWGHDSQCAP